jgi:hypothetical protein
VSGCKVGNLTFGLVAGSAMNVEVISWTEPMVNVPQAFADTVRIKVPR